MGLEPRPPLKQWQMLPLTFGCSDQGGIRLSRCEWHSQSKPVGYSLWSVLWFSWCLLCAAGQRLGWSIPWAAVQPHAEQDTVQELTVSVWFTLSCICRNWSFCGRVWRNANGSALQSWHLLSISLRLSSSTEQSTSSRLIRKHKRRRRKQRMRQIDRVRLTP